jgi:putative pyrimidine permease RutG
MFGATVLAPLLMGFDPNVAILFSGIGTLVFFVAAGLVVMLAGYRWIERLMPPVVTGAVVAVIGLNLAPIRGEIDPAARSAPARSSR